MTLPERQSLEKELGEIKVQLDGRPRSVKGDGRGDQGDPTDSRPELLQNRAALEGRKRKIEELLNKDDDLVAKSDGERKALDRERKNLEAELAPHLLNARERAYRMGSRPQDYESAVQKTVYQQQHLLKKIQRWQEIMRQLEPNDPTACDVRRLKTR